MFEKISTAVASKLNTLLGMRSMLGGGAQDRRRAIPIVSYSPNILKCHFNPMAMAIAGNGENSPAISEARIGVRGIAATV